MSSDGTCVLHQLCCNRVLQPGCFQEHTHRSHGKDGRCFESLPEAVRGPLELLICKLFLNK